MDANISLEDALEQKTVVVICYGMAGTGSVAGIARAHCRELGKTHNVIAISNTEPSNIGLDTKFHLVKNAQFRWMRRFAHVPKEIAFCASAAAELKKICEANDVDFVLCHSHGFGAPCLPKS